MRKEGPQKFFAGLFPLSRILLPAVAVVALCSLLVWSPCCRRDRAGLIPARPAPRRDPARVPGGALLLLGRVWRAGGDDAEGQRAAAGAGAGHAGAPAAALGQGARVPQGLRDQRGPRVAAAGVEGPHPLSPLAVGLGWCWLRLLVVLSHWNINGREY